MARAPRRRRPRWLLLGALLTLLVLAVNAASGGSDGPSVRLAQLAYLDRVRPAVERSTEQGADLVRVRDEAARLGRAAVGRRLQRVAAEARSVLRLVREADPPESLETSHNLLVATMAIRARAAEQVREALTRALGTDPPEPAVDALVRAGRDLATGDGTYVVFLDSIPRVDGKPAGAMPPSEWVPGGLGWTGGELAAFVHSLRASASLAPVHDLAVALVTTDPAAVGSEGATSVLPAVRSLRLQIVVANVGNEAEKRVPVVATLTADGVSDSARDFVDLAPGQRATVVLGGLRPVAGAASTLSVTIGPVEGEARLEDNTLPMPLVFR
ncbi:MAG TPA: hypothetical protein VHF47_13425 [Acidimicrobiales bacterium]|nr:hypothetical protein [Acidimicrobiales bacterium]